MSSLIFVVARKTGETAPAGTGTVLYPCLREGGALSDRIQNRETEGLLPPFFLHHCGHKHMKNPASEEAG